jgi:hypothetical protein
LTPICGFSTPKPPTPILATVTSVATETPCCQTTATVTPVP